MAILSPTRKHMPILAGLPSPYRGKVRDTYDLGNGLLLIVATDAVSIFDFVLNAQVRDKGWVLNVMAHFFLTFLKECGFRTHLVAAGADIDRYLPQNLRGNIWLQRRAMVVRRLTMYPVEFVHRRYYVAASSSFKKNYDSEKGGSICGHILPPGLQDGDPLPYLMDTPTTKADTGDEDLNHLEVRRAYPEGSEMSLDGFIETSKLLERVGILRFDGKDELGVDDQGFVYFGDENCTPDCSRFVMLEAWKKSQLLPVRKAPPAADKQIVRAKGLELGFGNLKASRPGDHPIAHDIAFPEETLEATHDVYFAIGHQAMGRTVEDYSEHVLGIKSGW